MSEQAKHVLGAISVADGCALKNVLAKENYLYFTTEEGVFVRLSYHRTHGWRLQTNPDGYESFCDAGASQTLAR